MNKLSQWITKSRGSLLSFCLLAGLAYFSVVMKFIQTFTSVAQAGMLLGFFFFPAVICGMALLLFKLITQWMEEDKTKNINFLFIAHILLFVIAAVFAVDMFIH
jgi:putative effector of murein hydrolase LrgA (UPF0299 family)